MLDTLISTVIGVFFHFFLFFSLPEKKKNIKNNNKNKPNQNKSPCHPRKNIMVVQSTTLFFLRKEYITELFGPYNQDICQDSNFFFFG